MLLFFSFATVHTVASLQETFSSNRQNISHDYYYAYLKCCYPVLLGATFHRLYCNVMLSLRRKQACVQLFLVATTCCSQWNFPTATDKCITLGATHLSRWIRCRCKCAIHSVSHLKSDIVPSNVFRMS